MKAGRSCPNHYYYGANAIAQLPRKKAHTLYVVGGLYGNPMALETIETFLQKEKYPITVVFNGDFNWFNCDKEGFISINNAVFKHDAILGNVEIELFSTDNNLGCGCAYPEYVDDAVVLRSNEIHHILKNRARLHPEIISTLATLPMVRCYKIGNTQIAVVHGDSSSLAGWNFGERELRNPTQKDWLLQQFSDSKVDVFASTHTCLPALKSFQEDQRHFAIINNGSAGMPNFRNTNYGIITRISVFPSPHETLYGCKLNDLYIDALPIHYDHEKWLQLFTTNWPKASPASLSYFDRICFGPDYHRDDAVL